MSQILFYTSACWNSILRWNSLLCQKYRPGISARFSCRNSTEFQHGILAWNSVPKLLAHFFLAEIQNQNFCKPKLSARNDISACRSIDPQILIFPIVWIICWFWEFFELFFRFWVFFFQIFDFFEIFWADFWKLKILNCFLWRAG